MKERSKRALRSSSKKLCKRGPVESWEPVKVRGEVARSWRRPVEPEESHEGEEQGG